MGLNGDIRLYWDLDTETSSHSSRCAATLCSLSNLSIVSAASELRSLHRTSMSTAATAPRAGLPLSHLPLISSCKLGLHLDEVITLFDAIQKGFTQRLPTEED